MYPLSQGSEFKAEDVIEIYLPPSLQLLNTQNSYLLFDLQLKSNHTKISLSERAGCGALFSEIVIRSDIIYNA